MAVIRTRFLFWLIKAYVKKWGKLFVIFFSFGLLMFFLILRFSPVLIRYIPAEQKTIIGLAGAYTTEQIPERIIGKVARGLTKIDHEGNILPDIAASWKISDNGKTYNFRLKKNVYFTDGTRLTSNHIQYSFKDVTITRPDNETIVFKLKEEYAPFLVTVSKPVFHKGYIGVGDFLINKIDVNGDFIKSIQLAAKDNKFKIEEYIFYPTNDSLKTAFALGELTRAQGLTETKIRNTSFDAYPNVRIDKKPNFKKLITVFYNTEDPMLSDKKWRNALSYALPDTYPDGDRIYNPYSPQSVYFNTTTADRRQDFSHAELLKKSAMESASASATPKIHIKTLAKYRQTAEIISENWKKLQIHISLEEVDSIPQTFQVYIGDFSVPKDPDQYTLWHSGQNNNITKLKNLRIDKLLEDGRRNSNPEDRIDIYNDFQKYLLDESPAAFLYFPNEYEISRK